MLISDTVRYGTGGYANAAYSIPDKGLARLSQAASRSYAEQFAHPRINSIRALISSFPPPTALW